MNEEYGAKTRAAFIRRSARMRALNMMAAAYPEEYEHFYRRGAERAANLYDALDPLFDSLRSIEEGK